MTTTPQTATHEKAHADNMGGFIGYIADIDNATPEQRAQDADLSQLDSLQDDLGLATNHTDKTRYLDDDISMRGGNSKGGKLPDTKGSYGLIMVNNRGEPVNIAAHKPNSDKLPTISDNTQASAYAIGSMSHDSNWWLVTSLSDAVTLYANLSNSDPNITVLACLNPNMFDMTLRHFSEVKTIHITDTAQHKDRLVNRLAGINAIAHITIDAIISRLNEGDLISNLIADADTIELKVLAWGEPEPLANDPSTAIPYPIDAFKGLLKNVVKAVAHYSQVPDAMAGQCVLGALAHMGQRFIDAPMGHGHMPASLIIITEGESGSGKTQVMGLTHFKIEEHERQQYEQYLQDLEVWENDKVGLKGTELKEYLSNTPKPTNPKTVFDDATIEPILDKFVDGEISNASWSTDEAGQFFNGHTMKGDTAGNALGAITKLHSNGRASRQRSQKSAHATPRTDAYDIRMTLLLQGQRVILEPALTDPLMNGQGFLARALIACPEDLRGKRVWNDEQRNNDNPYDNPDLIEYWSRCHALLDPLPASQPNDSTGMPQRIKIQWENDNTKQVFNNLAQDIENRQAQGQTLEYLKAYASRMAENASRIASLMAFFDGRKVITIDDIIRAFMLVEYSTAERLRYLDATPNGEQNDSEKLSSWLIDKARGKNPHKLNRTDIYNGAPKPMRKNNRILQGELDNLESKLHIRQTDEGRKKIIEVNPKLYK
jgi:histone H3/H4